VEVKDFAPFMGQDQEVIHLQREAGMGLAAGEQGPQERQNDSEHDRTNFGR